MIEQENEMLDESEVMALRREKLAYLREGGFNFPNKFRRSSDSASIINKYDSQTKEELESVDDVYAVAGRIMLKRGHGD